MTELKMPEYPDQWATMVAYHAGVPEEHLALWWPKWWDKQGWDRPWSSREPDITFYEHIRIAKRIMEGLWGEIKDRAEAEMEAFGQEAKDANLRLCAAVNRISVAEQRKIERGG